MPLRRLLPLLSCPLCAVSRGRAPFPLLRHPFTLHCGHTVCSSHLKTLDPTQRCPLPVCSSTPIPDTARPNIPSSSRVIYLPAAPPPPSARQSTSTSTDQFEQRVDITISKLIEVVSRHPQPLPPPSNQGDPDTSDGDDHQVHLPTQPPPRITLPSSDGETEFRVARGMDRSFGRRRRRRAPGLASQSTIPNQSEPTLTSASSTSVFSAGSVEHALSSSPGHAGNSCSPPPRTAGGESSDGSDLSPEPPKKRPRRDTRHLATDLETQSRTIEPEAEIDNSDSPNHPNANRPQSNRLDAEPCRDPVGGEDLRARIDKEILTELSCEICFTIYYQPVTTPCQHTFCGRCLQRSLDHRSHCPICRADLPDYIYLHDIPQNKAILSIELEVFPELYAERGKLIEEEERSARLDTPLFVGQLSFPGVPTKFHFFEPRYRLMLRRCLESPTPRFGMIMPPRTASTKVTMEFGTMLEIRGVRMLQDGRSLVYTWGGSRFRILERSTLDGYMVGRIEYIEDFTEEVEDTLDAALEEKAALEAGNQKAAPSATLVPATPAHPSPSTVTQTLSTPPLLIVPPNASWVRVPHLERRLLDTSNEALMNKCRTFVERLRDGAAPWMVQKLNESYGDMPTDASSFSFWVALVLPIDDYEKAKLLPIRSPRLRLKLVAHWINQLNSNW